MLTWVTEQSARELTAASWGQDVARALSRCDSIIQNMASEVPSSAEECMRTKKLASILKSALHDVWKEVPADVFDVG